MHANSQNNVIRKGSAASELAIVAPVLMALTIGVIEVTTAIHLQQSLTVAAYEGARVALQPETTTGNIEAASTRLLEARKVKSTKVAVSPSDFASQPYGTPIQVKVTAPLNANLTISKFLDDSQVLEATVTMMKER